MIKFTEISFEPCQHRLELPPSNAPFPSGHISSTSRSIDPNADNIFHLPSSRARVSHFKAVRFPGKLFAQESEESGIAPPGKGQSSSVFPLGSCFATVWQTTLFVFFFPHLKKFFRCTHTHPLKLTSFVVGTLS